MSDSIREASDADLAGQALPVDGDIDDTDLPDTGLASNPEANDADLIEQHRSVPLADEDYDR